MTTSASKLTELKVAPGPDRRETAEVDARGDDSRRAASQPPARQSLVLKLMRGFFQLLLPLIVVAAGVGIHQYLKATKPEAPKRKPQPTIYAVMAVPVRFGNVQPELKLYGSTVAGRQVEIRSLVAGKVASTSDSLRDGGKLSSGETIIEIDPFNFKSSLSEAQAQAAETAAKIREFEASLVVERGNLKFAREQVVLAEIDLNRAEPLSRRGTVTERLVDERKLVLVQRRQAVAQMENNIKVWEARINQQKAALERIETNRRVAEQRLTETRLVAPFNAYVTDVGAQVGRMLGVNDRVATLIDRDWIEVAFTVTDRQFGRLALANQGNAGIQGRKVEVRWNVGDKPLVYGARIDRVGASVTSQAGGVQLYARIENPDRGVGLRPGAFVEVRVPDAEFSQVASLPSTAVFNGDTVYAISDGKLSSRKVSIVSTSGADVLVRGNLKAGERIMTTRLSLPGDGVRVRVIEPGDSAGREKPAGKAGASVHKQAANRTDAPARKEPADGR